MRDGSCIWPCLHTHTLTQQDGAHPQTGTSIGPLPVKGVVLSTLMGSVSKIDSSRGAGVRLHHVCERENLRENARAREIDREKREREEIDTS